MSSEKYAKFQSKSSPLNLIILAFEENGEIGIISKGAPSPKPVGIKYSLPVI